MLRKELYANPKKCIFLTAQIYFLTFLVSTEEAFADPEKIRAIKEWPEPKNINDVMMPDVFIGLPTFAICLSKGSGLSRPG